MLAPAPASPESAGMSKTGFDRIEAHLKQKYLDSGRFPGTQMLVFRRGKVVHSAVQGFADVERKAPMKDDTIFRIYSMTKPLTSVAFMMLVEEGRVALDEPVHKYIPEWKNLGVFQAGTASAFLTKPPARPMLIVDLLRHTSGLTYGFQQRSNVDAAYREPFEQFLKERILDPLGMNDTGFFVPPEKAHRFAACYSADPKGGMTFHAADRKGTLTLQDDPTKS